MYVHLINDEKFLTPFMRRAKDFVDSNLYIVFGHKPPYKFLSEEINIIHSSQWKAYQDSHHVKVQRIFIHLLTFQKIIWVKKGPQAPVYWIFYGNDLYELLHAFKGFDLYEKADAPHGIFSRFKGKTFIDRFRRWIQLSIYHRYFSSFVKHNVDFWCFWNIGDYELLVKYYDFQGQMIKFQYGAFNPADIELVKSWMKDHPGKETNQILLNHSGSRSGNHKYLLKLLNSFALTQPIKAPLSYGEKPHIRATLAYGKKYFGKAFIPLIDYLDRIDYFALIYASAYAIFGHRRQEAGNTLFIAFMTGTKRNRPQIDL
jgi:hypothetical protein